MSVEIEYEELPASTPPSISMLAGAMAGILEHTCVYPLDVLKTRMQVGEGSGPRAVGQFRVLKGLSSIANAEGISRLFRGIGSVVLGAGPAHAVYFGTYEALKGRWVGHGREASSPLTTGLAGALSTAASDAFMTPFDTIKQRMQLKASTHSGIISCAHAMWQREGLRSFYLSYPTTLCLTMPFHAIQFPVYEAIRHWMNAENTYNPVAHIVAGGVAGGTAAAITTPIDVVKTTLQTQRISPVASMKEAVVLIHRQFGPTGFVRGLAPRVLAHMPSTAVCWTIYEYFKWVLV